MNGSRIRKMLAAFLAVIMCGAVLSQAAGPREFLSGIWDKRPRVSETRLNPKNWNKSEKVAPNATGQVRNSAKNSIRESLDADPFRSQDTSRLQGLVGDSTAAIAKQPEVGRARQGGESVPRFPSTFPQPSATDNQRESREEVREAVGRSTFKLEDFPASEQARRVDLSKVDQRVSEVEERDFSPGFEALVQQVIADRKKSTTAQADRAAENAVLPPSVLDRKERDVSRQGIAGLGQESSLSLDEQDTISKGQPGNQAGPKRDEVGSRRDARVFDDFSVEAPQPTMQINPGPMPGTRSVARDESSSQLHFPEADASREQFPNERSQRSVQDLIDTSRREMRTGISSSNPTSDLQPVAQSQRDNQSNRLRLLEQDPPLVLSPQLPRDVHRYADQSNTEPISTFRPAQDFDKDWSRSRIDSSLDGSNAGGPGQGQGQGQVRSQSTSSDYQPMIITPRVTANQAPRLSVPNNQQYRRLSYEESAPQVDDKVDRLEAARPDDGQPLMMLPSVKTRDAHPSKTSERANSETRTRASSDSRESNSPGPIGPINWGDSAETVAPASASLPWLMMATIAVCTTAIISLLIVRTRKVVMATSRPSNATNEAV